MSIQVTRQHSFTGHNDAVYALQGAKTSNHFFSGAGDGMIVLWDMDNPDKGELIAKLPNSIYALNYHAKRDVIIAGHNYEGIHILDWQNKKEIGSLQLTKAAVFDLQSWGDLLFIATGDGTVIVADIGRLSVIDKIKESEKSARTIAIHPLKKEFAVGYSDHYIRIFDLESREMKMEYKAHLNSVFTLRYSPDGNYLLSGARDARLKTWDVKASYILAAEVVAHMYALNHVEFSPDGKHFVTCSMDKSIKVWDANDSRLLKVIDKSRHAGHGTSVNKLLWTPYHNQLLSASDDRTVSSWNINFETTPL
jgi:WD40 repeat protein